MSKTGLQKSSSQFSHWLNCFVGHTFAPKDACFEQQLLKDQALWQLGRVMPVDKI